VQRNAMAGGRGEGDFLTFLKADKDVTRHMSDAEIEANFEPQLSLQTRRHDLSARIRKRLNARK